MPFQDYYRGRRVLVTGHTGFKGGWLSLWLHELGAEVHGCSLPQTGEPGIYEVIRGGNIFAGEASADVRDPAALEAVLRESRPEIVFHLAAQALVRRSYAEPVETFATNVNGTINLLEAVRRLRLPCAVVVVTSDKCYENQHWEQGYRETDPLGGHDVYSMSKAAAELVVQAWRRSFFGMESGLGPLATARAGNVIGGGDYAEDRLVPDCVRSLAADLPIAVRNPHATRPWQHVLDCLSGYLTLGARLGTPEPAEAETAFNFGPAASSNRPVSALVQEFLRHWPGEWRDESNPAAPHEAQLLHLTTDRAAARLAWFPTWDFAEAVRETARWYRSRHAEKSTDLLAFSRAQLTRYRAAAEKRQLVWALS